ncbi:Na+/H+ antiporter NhaD [Syntrophus gentianae]|uniref:Na+/H+ antiporter NhaD n=1 Tax=Syntrophus gentianae TaxID=43775 RepID=A0A1H8BFF0_9BACT|nr:sodium:proton antiporter [Syntrophus gentianae]SEM81661.1 Na+/H+ antiporter NhaD [Syntrophus gentianae]
MKASGKTVGIGFLIFLSLLIALPVNAAGGGSQADFPLWSGIFFVGLLCCIAVIPLLNAEWWVRNFGYVSLLLTIPAAVVVATRDWLFLVHVILEYLSFILLLGSLFVTAGGIVIRVDIRGTPVINSLFLLIGAVFASLIGTTGASMVLLRPLIRSNKWRKKVVHIYIFFIFLVSNIGGLLTPLGDPPLFLGFLRGVPFFWTLRLLPIWCVTVAILLALFFLLDSYFVKKEDPEKFLRTSGTRPEKKLEIKGKINFLFLLMILCSLFIPPLFREGVMILATGLSLYFTHRSLREENVFSFAPILEVAILFAAIFVTMAPVLSLLQVNGSKLGVVQPWQFFWVSGSLSSFLDNAPTYLVFMSIAQSVAHTAGIMEGLVAGVPQTLLAAISVGCVFMGANSYIGNGPNFMVKAICEENGVKMPSFFGYMAWSVGILIPLFFLVTMVFFR